MGSLGGREGQENNLAKVQGGRFGRGTPPEAPTWATAGGRRVGGPRPHTPYPGHRHPPTGSPGALPKGGGFRVAGPNPPARRKIVT